MEQRLTRRDLWLIGALLAVTALALIVGIRLFPRAFPEATIELTLGRGESLPRAETLLASLGYDVSGYMRAERFTYSTTTKVFLEREMGLAQADSAFSGELRLWRWGHRWFRPLQEESFRVEFTTSGELALFEHRLEEETPAGALADTLAQRRAEAFLRDWASIALDQYTLVGSRTKTRPHRIDRAFTWERTGRRWANAPLRVEVTVQGDRIGGFRTWLEVPESWQRSYAALRSRNQVSNSVAIVLYGLLIIALAAGFVRRIARRAIQWRTAIGFSLVGMLLVLLGELNTIPSWLYGYDTHQDLSSFLVLRILGVVAQCVGFGLLIFLLTAGGEAVYREAFPQKISLGGFFTRRGVRTRRFFLAILAGYALTAGFFAYQSVFYCLADSWGAWAPADVPYDNMLNTALPWAFVLLIGFAPAVTEEFTARLFAIPFLSRLLRSRLVAVVIAAAIWGFAHSNYPNQPFYIRGLEVGLAGIVVGVVLLRMNILAVLVWHYTVDALYSAYLLLRSGNPYFVISGALASGLLLVPFVYALVAYLRSRQFASPTGILNRDAAPPLPPVPRPVRAVPRLPYQAISGRRWGVICLVTGLLVAGLQLLPAGEWGDLGRFEIPADEARRLGEAELREMGAPLDSLRLVIWEQRRVPPEAYRYGAEQSGMERTRRMLAREVGTPGWVVRAFAPERKEEWRLTLSAVDGRLLGFQHRIAEEAAGDSLPDVEAQRVAEAFLTARGVDLALWRLMDSQRMPRPERLDHYFTWEAKDSTRRLGEGAVRVHVGVWGSEIGQWGCFFKIPDEWQRAREDRTPFDAVRMGMLGLLILAALIHGTRLLLRAPRLGRIAWRTALLLGLVLMLVRLVGFFVGWEAILRNYDTSEPWSLYISQSLLLTPFGILLTGLATAVGLALLSVPHRTIWDALHRINRRVYIRDALLGALVAIAALVILARLGLLLSDWLPGAWPRAELSVPPGIASRWALWPALGGALTGAAAAGVMLGFGAFLVGAWGRLRPLGLVLLLVATVALIPGDARTPGEVLAAWLMLLAAALCGLLLLRFVLRDNIPAYGLLCLVLGASAGVRSLLSHPVTRTDGLLLIGLLLVTVATFFLRGRPAAPQTAAGRDSAAPSTRLP